MKKQYLYLLILIIIPIIGLSQIKSESNFEYEIGQPHEFIKAKDKYYFYENNEVLTLKLNGENAVIQKTNTTKLNTITTKFYNDVPQNYSVEYVGIIDDGYFFFYSIYDSKTNSSPLYYREIDFEEGSFTGEALLFIKPNFLISPDLFSLAFSRAKQSFVDATNNSFITYGFYFNRDRSKLLINYRRDPSVSDNNKDFDVLGFHVFDDKLKEIWSKDISMPYSKKKMKTFDFAIDSSGNAYVLAAIIDGKGSKMKLHAGIPNYHMELIRINSNTQDIEKLTFPIENRFLSNVYINQGNDDEIICTGFYGYDLENVVGIFTTIFNNSGVISQENSFDFPPEIVSQYTKKSKGITYIPEFKKLFIKKFIVNKDGSIIIIGEQSYTVPGSRTINYHYNYMIITKLNAIGDLEWIKKLPKHQHGNKDIKGSMSFTHFTLGNSHFLFFLDNVKNLNLSPDIYPYKHYDDVGGYLTAYKVNDSTGDILKLSLLNTRNVNGIETFQFAPERLIPISNNEIVLEVYKKQKEDLFIKVKINK